MDWKDLASTVAKSAPALGAALGGPAGAAVGGLIAAAFSVDRSAAAVAEAVVGLSSYRVAALAAVDLVVAVLAEVDLVAAVAALAAAALVAIGNQ